MTRIHVSSPSGRALVSRSFRSLLLLALCLVPLLLQAQDRGFDRTEKPSNPEQRVALIIGNESYKEAPLINPVNDARGIAAALEAFGFTVIKRENADFTEMKRAIREFGRSLQSGSVGLFYYSGHGMQVKGENYLIPIGAQIGHEEEIEYEAVNAGFVLAQMEAARNRMNIVILDACRNNPFSRGFRSAAGGLATMNAPTGSMIAYATAPGSTASDGIGKNGLYTEQLLAQMKIAGQKIEDVFKRVRANVMSRSNSQQVPWEASSLIGDFYFVPPNVQPVVRTVEDDAVTVSIVPKSSWYSDGTSYWLSIDGEFIQHETVSGYAEHDLLVFHGRSSTTYLLRDFGNKGDNKERPVEKLSSSHSTFWRGNDGLYYLVTNGITIQHEATSDWLDKDLVVYHQKTDASYALRDFNDNSDNKFRVADVLPSQTSAYWKAANGLYWLVAAGKGIQKDVVQAWSGNDLIAYYEPSNATLVLNDYVNRQDGQIRAVETFSSSCAAVWRASGNYFWLHYKGETIQNESTSSYSGDDLIVIHEKSGQKFLLGGFKNLSDNRLRQAECIE